MNVPPTGAIRAISLVIGTCNRAETLRQALSHASACEIPASTEVEIIVVDNNSTDGTREVIETCARTSPIPMHYIFEPRQGVCWARNAGIAMARGDVISIIDDDVIVDRRFFVSVKREYETRGWRGIVGGRVELWDPTDLPLTILTDRSERRLAPDQHPSGFLLGCNMSVHRDVFAAIGDFDRRLGPGTAAKAADELDLYYRAVRRGFEVVYCPDILAHHNHGRKTPEAGKALTAGYQIARGAFYAKHTLLGDRRVQRYVYWEIYGLIRAMLRSLPSGTKVRADWEIFANYVRGAASFIRTRRQVGPQPEAIDLRLRG